MADRLLERAFNRVHAQVNTVQGEAPPAKQRQQQQQPAEPEVKDAIQGILSHWRNKEYFKLIQLPEPTADELGRPIWSCTPGDVSRAYRKLSVMVHPDKVAGSDAREAFEALNQAHRMLKDPSQLEEILRVAGARVRREKERADAAAAVDSSARAALASSRNQEVRRLRQEEGRNFQGTIMEQMKRRQDEAKRKAEAVKRARHGPGAGEEGAGNEGLGGGGAGSSRAEAPVGHKQPPLPIPQQQGAECSDGEDGDAQRRRHAAMRSKRKKPTFM